MSVSRCLSRVSQRREFRRQFLSALRYGLRVEPPRVSDRQEEAALSRPV